MLLIFGAQVGLGKLFTYPKLFLFCDLYFGFYGGSKFRKFWVPLELKKMIITLPVHVLQTFSLCQSTSFNPQNLLKKNWGEKIFDSGDFQPMRGHFGYPQVLEWAQYGYQMKHYFQALFMFQLHNQSLISLQN